MAEVSINYLFDDTDVIYLLQFGREASKNDSVVNKLVGFTKQVIATQREKEDGEVDVEQLDQTPVLLFKTHVDSMRSELNVLASPKTPTSVTNRCKALAEAGPREVLSRVMPLYVANVILQDNELRYKGVVMRFDGEVAGVYQGEPQIAREIELLVSLFFPELNPKADGESKK